jgi:nucleoside recognition membrane protein YjiH
MFPAGAGLNFSEVCRVQSEQYRNSAANLTLFLFSGVFFSVNFSWYGFEDYAVLKEPAK